ncbi:hypothetical protein [Cryptosporangium phraense]|uniref:YcxB family protein n=1 Tax=Cryptosporangium phraense TaxID=2593070 RepID=A0A545AN70_9ACTN|nr:hypothetical protein [Cryptosporangium phraense]TQS42784.1 hypothetical protein FL583_22230 [Cryptosporangium phraense]
MAIDLQPPEGTPHPIPVTTTYQLTPRRAARAYRASHRVVFGVLWALLLAGGVWALLTGDLSFLVAGAAGMLTIEALLRLQLRAARITHRPITLALAASGYHQTYGDRSASLTWTYFTNIQRRGDFWVLRCSLMSALSIPADALNGARTTAFPAFAADRGLTSPRGQRSSITR